ncbi:MAG: hypothetical protein KA007_00435 [Candidatus Pacebacteria bacterium]|nr:hypothetical protein [Candidatus Paceibacterota bacterium]
MGDFRIIDEVTTKFKCSTVYVMLFKDGDNFGVEVVDRHESFGRILMPEIKDANLVFSVVSRTISNQLLDKKIKQIKDRKILKENLLETFFHWL